MLTGTASTTYTITVSGMGQAGTARHDPGQRR
jgi:hypothetical protein